MTKRMNGHPSFLKNKKIKHSPHTLVIIFQRPVKSIVLLRIVFSSNLFIENKYGNLRSVSKCLQTLIFAVMIHRNLTSCYCSRVNN